LLGEGGADLVLLPETIRTRLPRERLHEEEWVCVVDADNTDVGAALEVPDLVRLPHVVFDLGGMSVPAELTWRAVLAERRIQATVSDFLTIPFLLRGTSISVLPGRLAQLLSAHGMLRIVQRAVPLPQVGIDMVWNPRGGNDPAYAWLRAQLRELV
jgi:DNA-binding transcriptional LysR family regulator